LIELDYTPAGVPVRADLQAAHRALWEHVRSPGTWWTGAERVAIASEARRAVSCGLCARRKEALSPRSVAGAHDGDGALPAAIVDVIHRLRTDSGRLSREWFDEVMAGGLSDVSFVELVGVVSLVTGVDHVARALGVPLFALPEPAPGEPSRRRPAAAKPGTAWVPMIAPEDARGADADVYGGSPFVPNIIRALSLVPAEVRMLRTSSDAHYLPVEQIPDPSARRALDRMQIELVAARVSALNQCFY
jgi:alkylhydroperoxidase family enzyme